MDDQRKAYDAEKAAQMATFQEKVQVDNQMLRTKLKVEISQTRHLRQVFEEQKREVESQQVQFSDELAAERQLRIKEKEARMEAERKLRTLLNQHSNKA